MLSRALPRHVLSRARAPLVAPLVGARNFWNVSLPGLSGPGGSHITKYQIVKPGKENVEWDDFLIALPDKDQLASFSKEVPLFIRYLKVVTDQDGRQEAFQAFLERSKSGLVVESDAFITTEELLAVMWKNGFSESERNAIQFTFPSDYKFHYPEVSVLFDITEEDTYKFCMRTRMDNSHIGELDWSKVKRQGWMRDHWLVFGVGLVIFKYFPFFNYYFGVKVFGTSMWWYTMFTGLSRWIAGTCRRNEYMAAQKTASDVMDGEDKIVEAMRRFANDGKCVEYLNGFKDETNSKISNYRASLTLRMKEDMDANLLKQLQAIVAFEAGMGSAMQELVVREAASSFRDQFATDPALQGKAFSAALKGLSGDAVTASDDPVTSHFMGAFNSVQGVDLSKVKGNQKGSLAERVAFAQQTTDAEFKETFMVSSAEAAEVKTIASKAKVGDGYDFTKLSADAADRLDALYTSINAKVGYHVPDLSLQAIPLTADKEANEYVAHVNTQMSAFEKQIRNARLSAFVAAF